MPRLFVIYIIQNSCSCYITQYNPMVTLNIMWSTFRWHVFSREILQWRHPFLKRINGFIVVGVMKMGNTVSRVGLEPASRAFWASVLLLHHIDSLMSPLYSHRPVYVALCLRCQCRLLQYDDLKHGAKIAARPLFRSWDSMFHRELFENKNKQKYIFHKTLQAQVQKQLYLIDLMLKWSVWLYYFTRY